jgi:stage III sporulation protein AB
MKFLREGGLMLFLKIIGGGAVCAASSAIGFYFSVKQRLHIDELYEFKKALLILKSEIDYALSPFAEAALNISRRTGAPAQGFFAALGENLKADGALAQGAWDAARSALARSRLDEEDKDALAQVGRTMGYLDKPLQLSSIDLALEHITSKTGRLEAGTAQNGRLYGSVGVIAGLMAVIALM